MIGDNGGPQIDTSKGYTLIHNDWANHPLVGVHTEYFRFWVDLLMNCAYGDGAIRTVNGHRYELRAGELVGAISYLANRWGVTPKRVRTFIDKAEAWRLVTVSKKGTVNGTQRGTQAQTININNYNELYDSTLSEGHAQRHAHGHAKGTQEARKGHESNYIKEINTHTDTRACARGPGPNEEEVSHGVIVNCETIRHRDGHFALSIPSIELATQGTVPRERVEAIVKGYALQWGLEIEAGKDPKRVIPNDAMAYVSAQVRKEFMRPIEQEFKRTRAVTAAQKQKEDLNDAWRKVLEEEAEKI